MRWFWPRFPPPKKNVTWWETNRCFLFFISFHFPSMQGWNSQEQSDSVLVLVEGRGGGGLGGCPTALPPLHSIRGFLPCILLPSFSAPPHLYWNGTDHCPSPPTPALSLFFVTLNFTLGACSSRHPVPWIHLPSWRWQERHLIFIFVCLFFNL